MQRLAKMRAASGQGDGRPEKKEARHILSGCSEALGLHYPEAVNPLSSFLGVRQTKMRQAACSCPAISFLWGGKYVPSQGSGPRGKIAPPPHCGPSVLHGPRHMEWPSHEL